MAEEIAFKKPVRDYTSRDYTSNLEAMVRSIPFFVREWTDHNPSDFGIAIVELLAMQLDVLNFNLDQQFFEGFWDTAKTRFSIVNHAALIDYQLSSPAPAKVDLTFSIAEVLTGDVIIPTGTQVQTKSSGGDPDVVFETTEEAIILAGETSVVVGAIEGETFVEFLGNSEGIEFQKFVFENFPVVDGSVSVIVDEGGGPEIWELKTTFIDSVFNSKHYVISRDENDKVFVEFGNNNQGKIPDTLAEIEGTYRALTTLRGNVNGNVGPETLTILLDAIFFNSVQINVSVTNLEKANGGEPRETITDAKRLGPLSIRTLGRVVTPDDYIFLTEKFPGVLFSKAVKRIENAIGCCDADVFIVPSGGGLPSEQLKSDLKEYLDGISMLTIVNHVLDPVYVAIDLEITVFLREGFSKRTIEPQIVDRFAAIFKLVTDAVDETTGLEIIAKFFRDVYLSDITCLPKSVLGVEHVDVSKLTRSPSAVLKVWTGDATFANLAIGTGSVIEEWEVRFFTETQFSVRGTVSGEQGSGSLGVTFISENGNLLFDLVAGSVANVGGDYATIKTSKFTGNVPIEFNEVPQAGAIGISFVER